MVRAIGMTPAPRSTARLQDRAQSMDEYQVLDEAGEAPAGSEMG